MKKRIFLTLFILIAVVMVISLASCGHECSYTVEMTDAGTAATCLKSGVKVMKCAECENTKNEIIPALGHDYISNVIEPTCNKEGYTTQACSRCGDTNGDAKLNKKQPTGMHNYVLVENSRVEATCTQNGYEIQKCSGCGHEKTANQVSAPGHNYVEKRIYNVVPTCTTGGAGVTTKRCDACNEKDPTFKDKAETYEPLGHDREETDAYLTNRITVTCTTAQRDTWTCKREGCTDPTLTKDVGEPLGHDYSVDAGVKSSATCCALEIRTYNCSRNGQNGCVGTVAQGGTSKDIPQEGTYTAHTMGAPATCVEAQVCSVCEASGRTTLGTSCDKNDPNCVKCSDYGMIHVFADPTGLHDYIDYTDNSFKSAQTVQTVEPTCMRQGYTVYRCTVCGGDDFKDNITAIVPDAHDVDFDTIVGGTTVPATCNKYEYSVHACTNTAEDGTTTCDYTEEKIVGNTYADHTISGGEPTGVITCTHCLKSFYDTTYVESKYNDGETTWDEIETEFDDNTNLNVTITVSKSNADPMTLTGNEAKTQVDANNPDTTRISIIRIITDDEDAAFVITVNGETIDHTGSGFIDLCEYGDITSLTVEATSLEGTATVYFYGEDAVPAE